MIRQITVIGNVAPKENHRADKRRHHAVSVGGFILAPDEPVACAQENCAQAVERGVDGRQIGWAHGMRSKVSVTPYAAGFWRQWKGAIHGCEPELMAHAPIAGRPAGSDPSPFAHPLLR